MLRGRHRRERQPVPAHPAAQRRPGARRSARTSTSEVNATTAPYFAYDHEREIVDGENCSIDESANEPGGKIWGISFYPAAGNFPAAYRGALFFGDELRECIWAMLPGADGLPQRNRVIPFAQDAASPLDIEMAPGGDLLWIDDAAQDVKRIRFTGNAATTRRRRSPPRTT